MVTKKSLFRSIAEKISIFDYFFDKVEENTQFNVDEEKYYHIEIPDTQLPYRTILEQF